MKKRMQKIPTALLLFIAVVSIASTAYFKRPSFLGYRFLYVPTASMEPTISTGSIILAQCISPSDLAVGDIAVYRMENSLIVHRIKDIKGDYVIFKGDNNNFVDSPVRKKKVLYKKI